MPRGSGARGRVRRNEAASQQMRHLQQERHPAKRPRKRPEVPLPLQDLKSGGHRYGTPRNVETNAAAASQQSAAAAIPLRRAKARRSRAGRMRHKERQIIENEHTKAPAVQPPRRRRKFREGGKNVRRRMLGLHETAAEQERLAAAGSEDGQLHHRPVKHPLRRGGRQYHRRREIDESAHRRCNSRSAGWHEKPLSEPRQQQSLSQRKEHPDKNAGRKPVCVSGGGRSPAKFGGIIRHHLRTGTKWGDQTRRQRRRDASTASTKAVEDGRKCGGGQLQAKMRLNRARGNCKTGRDASAVALEDATKKGIVQLSSETSSESRAAATPKAVVSAYDNAETRLRKTRTGQILASPG
ncbi:tail fiber protein [Salmonella enterica subsp. enterica]|nr:tail fiber protein [Salmonella enterica subsp. enterica]